LGGSGIRYKKAFLENLPVPKETKLNTTIITQLSSAVINYTRSQKAGEVKDKAATEKIIDDLVYQLYELTPEEIKLIEDSSA
jgi:hypothetical protein